MSEEPANDVLRIAVFGPESTGKTQLAATLAAHFGAPLVAEYAREFWDAHGLIALEDIPVIAREQWRREDEAAARPAARVVLKDQSADDSSVALPSDDPVHCHLIGDSGPPPPMEEPGNCHLIGDMLPGGATTVVICDTEALTTVLWSDLLFGTTPADIRRGAERRAKNYALYLLLDTDVPFAPDPQRCFPDPDDREKCRRIWRGALERRHLPFVEISGDWAARERAAIAAINELLMRPE